MRTKASRTQGSDLNRGAELCHATDLIEFVRCRCDVELKQQLRQHVEKLLTAGSCRKQPQTDMHFQLRSITAHL